MVCLAEDDQRRIRTASRLVSEVLQKISQLVKPGISTHAIDLAAEEAIAERKALSAFKGYRGYPCATCISVNEVVVHGIPSDLVLKDGDIVSVDVGLCYEGFYGDVAITLPVGEIDPECARLISVTKRALDKGIRKAMSGGRLGDISHSIQECVERARFSVIRDFVGHGIGQRLHESPEIPNFGKPHKGLLLREGMVLAIEPMTACGHFEVEIADDGWTARTVDRSAAAHFEHMVLIGDSGPEILTVHPEL